MRLNKNILLLVLVINFSCTEPFKLVTESFEDVLVVEATITDELKTQKIKVSRTYKLESDIPVIEETAEVKIVDSNNNEYDFKHEGDGVYNSVRKFQAVEGVSYKLFITTSDGKEYVSNEELLAPKAEMDLYAESFNLNGEIGAQVFVNSYDNLGKAKYFRYEYEETYKIVTPYTITQDALATNITGSGLSIRYDIEFVPRPLNRNVCYSSNYSNKILITNVNGLNEDKISRYPIRFLPSGSHLLRERYSILVKQYVQSANANNFYKILKELGSDESLLIDIQPGFIQGNIFPKQNPEEKVIGFFDVSSVTSKRIYFNYADFNFKYPGYFFSCDLTTLNYNAGGEKRLALYYLMVGIGHLYLTGGTPESPSLTFVSLRCGDCTTFSSNIKPEFWED
ncbi:DUF4249 domain-containing protein [Flavivirga algicola]|uniref:DUF4249 domain-containing protein n=1 Tax=Flavivirga algicola TaxID=2729136 RepID=A0ABX1RWM8_9FLAO|nr:DUF4249 domain-containing protein [Flavivirga algicola]NMH87078.1 DUF4249 domain-containing protein [Flavivirga algicola]